MSFSWKCSYKRALRDTFIPNSYFLTPNFLLISKENIDLYE